MTPDGSSIEFPPFRLDLQAESLRCGGDTIDLRPKTWQLLLYMAERPGRLMSREELLDAVWDDVTVTAASLTQAVLEIRKALGDDARNPRFIETVHRKGFRFVAKISEPIRSEKIQALPMADLESHAATQSIFGRDGEIRQLDEHFAKALEGHRQIVFVTGEPGIGKSRLLEEFLARLVQRPEELFVAGAQCVEFIGESEAYLPVLDALDRTAREPGAASVRQALKRFAPTWLAQLPWLLDQESEGTPPLAGTPARMLREFCNAIESLAAQSPTVLWLEDLHWSDPATIDLLGALARRAEPARLLILATYRPVDALMGDHPLIPLQRALRQQGMCHEVAIELLSEDEVAEFVASRFGDLDKTGELSKTVHDHTDGNPLFVETMIHHILAQGLVASDNSGWESVTSLDSIKRQLPDSLREIVQCQLDGLAKEEIEALEAASVSGETFPAQAVAAALDIRVDRAEAVCGRLAGWNQFLTTGGTTRWPDGSEGQSYRFHHQVFRRILYDRISPARRQRLHLRLAQGLEAANPELSGGAAAEISTHFERGAEIELAIRYLVLAAEGVRRRFADREAVAYLQRALDLLSSLPDTEDRKRRELEIRRQLARALVPAIAFSATEQRANAQRGLDLGRQLGDVENQLLFLGYRLNWSIMRGQLDQVRKTAEQAMELAEETADRVLAAHSPMIAGIEAVLSADHERSENRFKQSLSILDGIDPRKPATVFPLNFEILALSFSGWSAWLCGRPDEARHRTGVARERAALVGSPFGIAVSLALSAVVEVFCRDRAKAGELGDALTACLEEYGFSFPYPPLATAMGWPRTEGGNFEAAADLRRSGGTAFA